MGNILRIKDALGEWHEIPAIKGEQGPQGEQGVSIVNVETDEDNHLIVTLSDGTEIDAGEIQGGGGGASSWSELTGKPFNSLGETLQVDDDGVLNIVIPPEYGHISYNGYTLTVE